MAEIQRTYTFTAELTKGGHRRLDEALEACRWLYNDFLTARKTAYSALGVSLKGIGQSAPVKQNRAAGDRPAIPQPDARVVFVDSEPRRAYGGMSMTGLGPAQRRRRAEGYGCTEAELEPAGAPNSIRRDLNPNERKEYAELSELLAKGQLRNSYRLWRILWPGDAEEENLKEQYAWARWRHRNDWPVLDDAIDRIDDKSSLSDQLTAIRRTDSDLDGIDRRVEISTVINRLDKAFTAFFDGIKTGRKVGYPRYKGQSRWRTLEITAVANRYMAVRGPGGKWGKPDIQRSIGNGRDKIYLLPESNIQVGAKAKINIKGLPPIRFDVRRELPDCQPKFIRITRKARRVQVQLVYNLGEAPEAPTTEPLCPVGMDAGITLRYALSDGRFVPGRRLDRTRLEILQQRLSRTKRGSNNRRKARQAVAREWQRVTDSDTNWQHRASTALAKEYDLIAVEDLNIDNMRRSAKGTAETPGRNVSAKAGLNRGIGEQAWGRFVQMLTYKAESAGRRVVRVPPANTSRTCPNCGVIDGASRRTQAEFICVECGYTANADLVGATNVLYRGLALLGLEPGGTSAFAGPGARGKTLSARKGKNAQNTATHTETSLIAAPRLPGFT